jgi:hypothetical protein
MAYRLVFITWSNCSVVMSAAPAGWQFVGSQDRTDKHQEERQDQRHSTGDFRDAVVIGGDEPMREDRGPASC